jgi:hypothetical protein
MLEQFVRMRSVRQRGQDVIDFGLGVTAMALVALVGFNALGSAQAAYWGAAAPRLAAPTPAPGDFLHPTRVDAQSCGPVSIPLETAYTCTLPTVTDIYSDANERRAPAGWVGLHLDNDVNPKQVCHLSAPSGNQNSCSSLTWTPTDPSLLGSPHTMSLWYEGVAPYQPQSNHSPSRSAPQSVQFLPDLQFTSVSCVNDLILLPPGAAEIGNPLRCTVTLTDVSSGLPGVPPAAGTAVTWSTVNGPSYQGVGMFTCNTGAFNTATRTSAINIFSDSTTCQPTAPLVPNGIASFTCWTDTTGQCSILYRRLYDSTGKAVSNPTLTLTVPGNSQSYSGLVSIVEPLGPHRSSAVLLCASTDVSNVHVQNNNNYPYDPLKPYRNSPAGSPIGNRFRATTAMSINGSTGTQISCTVTVADEDPNPAADYANIDPDIALNSDPNRADAYPPAGTVNFQLDGTPFASCTLRRADVPAPPTAQAQGQAPFMSTCSAGPFTLNGSSSSTLGIDYAGEPGLTAGHSPTSFNVPIQFNCDC